MLPIMTDNEHRSAQRALQRLAGTRAPLGYATGRKPLKTYLAIIAAILLLGLAGASDRASSAPCLEDMPCWNWAAYGNGARGVLLDTGRVRVVDTCEFQTLYNAGRIRYSATYRRLPGDKWAQRYGCTRLAKGVPYTSIPTAPSALYLVPARRTITPGACHSDGSAYDDMDVYQWDGTGVDLLDVTLGDDIKAIWITSRSGRVIYDASRRTVTNRTATAKLFAVWC